MFYAASYYEQPVPSLWQLQNEWDDQRYFRSPDFYSRYSSFDDEVSFGSSSPLLTDAVSIDEGTEDNVLEKIGEIFDRKLLMHLGLEAFFGLFIIVGAVIGSPCLFGVSTLLAIGVAGKILWDIHQAPNVNEFEPATRYLPVYLDTNGLY